MNPQYTNIFGGNNEDNSNLVQSNIFLEDLYSAPATNNEQGLSVHGVWNMNNDGLWYFNEINSSMQTSEASGLTVFSDLRIPANQNSNYSQSLEIFPSGPDSAVAQGASNMGPNYRIPQSGETQMTSSNFESMPEYYRQPVVGRQAEVSLGWTFDALDESRSSNRPANDYDTITGNSDQYSFVPVNPEPMPLTGQTPISSAVQPRIQEVPHNFATPNQSISNDATHIQESETILQNDNSNEAAETDATGLHWGWQSFDYTQTNDPHATSLTAATNVVVSTSQEEDAEAEMTDNEQDVDPTSEKPSGKKGGRKAKPIATRFRPLANVSVVPSYVQCLGVVLNYHGFTGTISQVMLNNAITNVAYQRHNVLVQKNLVKKVLSDYYTLAQHEEMIGAIPVVCGRANTISVISGVLQRKIHIRNIDSIFESVQSIIYVKSDRFNIHNPYEPQYYRYELDAKGKPVNESKCGLCAFCPTVKFLPFKNSSYLSHMTLEHGIFASNFVVPEGLYYGKYRMVRASDPSKTRSVRGLQCPACFQVIEVACWKNKTNPLLSYFRHFKKIHSNLNKTFTSSLIDPVTLKHRGGNLSQSEAAAMAGAQ
ncbi:hypothetical protein JCM33374_g105 [Metschnikowia sp. JCM 33374]|nr:hypothetical protein JCM33374_g105 [Metschnikowia sp. JCM 33374]